MNGAKAARFRSALAVVAAAGMLCWPALWNRYPLLFPDSVTYLEDGRYLLRALLFHRLDPAAARSVFYSLGIYLVHWDRSLWPVVGLQAVLTAWVVWLAVRAVVGRRGVLVYLLLMAALSGLTTVSWYVSFVMPDILGPLVYLAMWLLVFARETLSRGERWGLCVLAVWGITAHATHLMLALGVSVLLGMMLWAVRRWEAEEMLRGVSGVGVAQAAALVAGAVVLQLGANAYLFGHASLFGNHPPYLMARVVADGPGAEYLRQNCAGSAELPPGRPGLDWAVCAHVNALPDNDDDFLWAPGSIWLGADKATQKRLLAEEMPLVRASVRAYPRQQLARSWANFTGQLNDFSVYDFDDNDWMRAHIGLVIPSAVWQYPRSRQAQDDMPVDFFTPLIRWVVIACAVLLAGLLPWMGLRRRVRLLGLVLVVVPVLVANAFVTAVLSSSDSRYEARVIWLLPLTAALAGMDWFAARRVTRNGG